MAQQNLSKYEPIDAVSPELRCSLCDERGELSSVEAVISYSAYFCCEKGHAVGKAIDTDGNRVWAESMPIARFDTEPRLDTPI